MEMLPWILCAAVLICTCLHVEAVVEEAKCNPVNDLPQLQLINSNNKTQLKQVFFSGEPWIVLCSTGTENSPLNFLKIESRLQAAGQLLQISGEMPDVSLGVANCKDPLPSKNVYRSLSGKTFTKNMIQKYSLNENISPLAFTVANGDSPAQLLRRSWKSPLVLAHAVVAPMRLKVHQLISSQGTTVALKQKCTSKRSCVLVLSNTTLTKQQKNTIMDLKAEFRNTSFVFVNATTHLFSLEPKLPPLETETKGAVGSVRKPRLLFLRKGKRPQPKARAEAAKTKEKPKAKGSAKKDKNTAQKTKASQQKKKQKGKADKNSKKKKPAVGASFPVVAKAHRGAFNKQAITEFLNAVMHDQQLTAGRMPTLERRRAPKKPKSAPRPPSPSSSRRPPASSKSKRPSAKKSSSRPPSRKKERPKTKAQREKEAREAKERERRRREEMDKEQQESIPQAVPETAAGGAEETRGREEDEEDDDEVVDLD